MKLWGEIGSLTKDKQKVYRRLRQGDRKFYTISYRVDDAKEWLYKNKDLYDFFENKTVKKFTRELINTNRFANSTLQRKIRDYWHCTEDQTRVLREIKQRYEIAEADFYSCNFENEQSLILIEFYCRKFLYIDYNSWKKRNFQFKINDNEWKFSRKESECCLKFIEKKYPETLI